MKEYLANDLYSGDEKMTEDWPLPVYIVCEVEPEIAALKARIEYLEQSIIKHYGYQPRRMASASARKARDYAKEHESAKRKKEFLGRQIDSLGND